MLYPLWRLALCCWLLGACLTAQAAPFKDSMAQRTLACAGCHGPQGRSGPDGYYPRLAGKPAGYLYNQLVDLQHYVGTEQRPDRSGAEL